MGLSWEVRGLFFFCFYYNFAIAMSYHKEPGIYALGVGKVQTVQGFWLDRVIVSRQIETCKNEQSG